MGISGNFKSIKIGLVSPEEIRKWSHGEVKKPETINYRTLKPEKDGLFCERIFGPVKDWECSCGKYKRIRYKGVICDRCGVEITKSITRRERMGHIELASPVSHVWYFKAIPSPLSLLLDVPPRNLEKIFYFAPDRRREQLFEVVESDNTGLEKGDIILDLEYRIHKKYNEKLKAEPVYHINKIKIFPHKIGDLILAEEDQELQKKFGKVFYQKELLFTVEEGEIKTEEIIEETVEEKKEVKKETLENKEAKYRITKIDGLISESNLNRLEEEQSLSLQAKLDTQNIEESCYIVIHPGNTSYKRGEIILELENTLLSHYDSEFKAGIGAEAIKELLQELNLDKLALVLREELKKSSGQKMKKFIKRLQIVEAFRKSNYKPDWMILDVIPVIPPDLRPMVQLEGGRFATSDLNDLYRRVINRNNRLKRLLEIGAPEIIIKNEKRMLQEAVDALIDNGRRGRAVLGAGNRPLKSLSDMLKGKKGRFRQNLLGKRVDYSGRSVIVVGPNLKFYQCGLPKKMALELFKPYVMRELVTQDLAHNIKTAKKIVEKEKPEVWSILEDIIKEHPILLNRAPTLHRLGIQAFKPVLVEGNAIQIHPLVCAAFNADFDGDQMAVHVPLSQEAQAEAEVLMLSSNNILSPANGSPIALPSQDIILGCYYLTMRGSGEKGEGKIFGNSNEAIRAYEDGIVGLHAKIKYRLHNSLKDTTIGRIIFNEVLPKDMEFVNLTINKKSVEKIISFIYRKYGAELTVESLDKIKQLGFNFATSSGISIGVVDLEIPSEKNKILEAAEKEVDKIQEQYNYGLIMDDEREQKIINAWTKAANEVVDAILRNLSKFNPLYIMADSGARGSKRQIGQLAGMRGLMADPSGKIIEFPIRSNFRDGLSVLEYFISTHGARKGLADTALRTSKSGYLTRRLVDVAQDAIIREEDCGTNDGIIIRAFQEDGNIIETLEERLVGRIVQEDVIDPKTEKVLIKLGEEIDEEQTKKIVEAGIKEVKVRSVLTCRAEHGVCAKCYGKDMATGKLVNIGEAVGVIAAQSIGEPGTQLTLRTFHTGGVKITGEDITLGLPRVEQLFEVRRPKKQAIISEINGVVEEIVNENNNRKRVVINPEIPKEDKAITEEKNKIYNIPPDLRLIVEKGQKVSAGERLTIGFVDPHEILKIQGIKAVQEYLLKEVQAVYRSQGVNINDKHIETIIRQIARLNMIYVRSARDSELLSGELVYISDFEKANRKVAEQNKEIAKQNRELLENKKAISSLINNKTEEVLVKKGEIITNKIIPKIETNQFITLMVEDQENKKYAIVRGEDSFIERITDNILIDVIKDNIKAGMEIDTLGDYKINVNKIISKETAIDIADSGIRMISCIRPNIYEKMEGRIIAENIIDPENSQILLSENKQLTSSEIDKIIKAKVNEIKLWEEVKEISIKDGLIKLVKDEIIGQPIAQDIKDPVTGNIIAAKGQIISKNLIKKVLLAKLSDLPLEDGRYFSLEGRTLEFIYDKVAGKIAALDILDPETGKIIISAGKKITKNDATEICSKHLDLIRVRTNNKATCFDIIENVGFIRRKKFPAVGMPIIQGITQASLSTESFLSAASFQRTIHVLTNASIKGKEDKLYGLKENVIIGNIIPAGTGLNKYGGIEVDFLHEEEEKVEGIFKEVEREQKGKEVNIFKEKNEDNKEQITNNSIIQGP
ncbi:MAG: DNA-directed RNA polymerase subunit beta' [Candidatus Infernicultor aquiphilus]|uniref:DNA-directed RNA polymerase subunit beta' n=1 Tax=Candidatus Infernicultor aquiphilus TaxID=1805029 RepID=A0A2M7K5U8_9BACT|nr:MAG: DNA-directed RNA polymerase subunit beta' [Candidatus Atribacteria bacterium CG08_land_8_20_14_0_20_33_29]PIX33528.1 MAG: DNA-directed RNA polymerase subunit beta' [Candidatus Atribacteria bacterium CG_4_8_14_3_um_filter_34_18]